MSEFNWVTARNACSLGNVFEKLKLDVQSDVEERQKLRQPLPLPEIGFDHGFVFTSNSRGFSASLKTGRLQYSSIFALKEDHILVTDEEGEELLKATVTLNNERECRLVVGNEEMEGWQFRKKALEGVFFSHCDIYTLREAS
jgi:hypothetical protein